MFQDLEFLSTLFQDLKFPGNIFQDLKFRATIFQAFESLITEPLRSEQILSRHHLRSMQID